MYYCKPLTNCGTRFPGQTLSWTYPWYKSPPPSQIRILCFCSVQMLYMNASSYCHRLRHTVCLHIQYPSIHQSVTTVIINTQYKHVNTTNTVNISSNHDWNVIPQLNYNDMHFKICSSSVTGSTIFLLCPISLPNTCIT